MQALAARARGAALSAFPRRSMTFVPYVIDRSSDGGERAYDLYSRMLEERIVFCQGMIEGSMANSIAAQLLFLESKDPTAPVRMYINSPGGHVTAGMAVYDTMQYIRCPVHTLCMGMAASMGATLLMAGEPGHRYSLPNAEVMVHQPLGGAEGSASDVERTVKNLLDTRERFYRLYARHTNQPQEVVERTLDRDTYMTAQEAKEFGIVDEIVTRRDAPQPE